MMNSDNISIVSESRITGGILGAVVGDALGVPVEFRSRGQVQRDPVTGMRAYGTHGQPAGTWSDDSSLLLCAAESLAGHEFDVEDMGRRFVRWAHYGHWSPHGVVFDIGIATSQALRRMAAGTPAVECGGTGEYDNGNGSLMRILPVCVRFAELPVEDFVMRIGQASALTHGHPRSVMACVFYGWIVRGLLRGECPQAAWEGARREFAEQYAQSGHEEYAAFSRVLNDGFCQLPESEISSSGYVIHTLEAAVWCLLTTRSYAECVLRAVNLGEDTDTTGCVAGGLAGLCYGRSEIPAEWVETLARVREVTTLAEAFAAVSGEG